MFEGEAYSIYKYGYIEDIDEIDEKSLYEHYKKIINECKIDLFITGDSIENVKVPDIKGKQIQKININHIPHDKVKVIKENLDVTQGKLIIGLNMPKEDKAAVAMYNTILGGGANSKLFQNVREKASLAYSAGSSYIRRQNTIFIKTGIEIKNYEKTLNIIKEQLEDMKNGKISDEEFNAAKKLITASIEAIPESEEDMITFYFDQRLFDDNLTVQDYLNKINNVTKEQVIQIAKKVSMDTIYFLKNKED